MPSKSRQLHGAGVCLANVPWPVLTVRRKVQGDWEDLLELGFNVHCYLLTLFLGQRSQLLERSAKGEEMWEEGVCHGTCVSHGAITWEDDMRTLWELWSALCGHSYLYGRGGCLLPHPGLMDLAPWADEEELTMCQRDHPHLTVLMGWTRFYPAFSHVSLDLTFKASDSFSAIMSAILDDILSVLRSKMKTWLSHGALPDFWRGNITSW